jgi:hypothetical protein
MDVHSLNDDELQNIFKHCSNATRARVVPLVCKDWYRVERRFAPQSACLNLVDNRHFDTTYVTWKTRDTTSVFAG